MRVEEGLKTYTENGRRYGVIVSRNSDNTVTLEFMDKDKNKQHATISLYEYYILWLSFRLE